MDAVSYSNSNASAGESGSGRNDLTILDCFDRPIAFHRCFVTLTGSVTAALMLSQAYYWQKRAKSQDGWWFKTRDDWIEETGMGRREQEGARKKLRALGILREDLRGVPATLWYKVEETKLLEAIANLSNPASSSPTLPTPVGTKPPFQLVRNRPTGRAETAQLEGRKPPNKLGQIAPTSNETETTTETTTEITTTTPNPSSTPEPAANPDDEGGCGGGFELVFDFDLADLTPEQQERARKTLTGLTPELAQQVLDEWNHAHACHGIRQSRWGWLRKVADAARAGQFVPSAELADRRQMQAQAQAQAPAPRARPPERQPSPVWRERREQLRNAVSDLDYGVYIAPLRGQEDAQTLWLEAPNRTVAAWVSGHLPLIEGALRPHTELPVRVCIG